MMTIESWRAEQARRRDLAPGLYEPDTGALKLRCWPGSIPPPKWMCAEHAALWRRWTDYKPYIPITLMSIGQPIPPEEKRRRAIGEQREVIAEGCHKRCSRELVQEALFEIGEVA